MLYYGKTERLKGIVVLDSLVCDCSCGCGGFCGGWLVGLNWLLTVFQTIFIFYFLSFHFAGRPSFL